MTHHCSATQLQKHDSCPRQWGWEYLTGIPSLPSPGKNLGSECHRAIEIPGYRAEEDGDKVAAIVEGARHLFPHGPAHQHEASFRLPVFPLGHCVGKIDYLRRPIPGMLDGELAIVRDLKTTKSFRYVKSEDELRGDWQAKVYAAAALILCPGVTKIRLEWVYVKTCTDRATREYPPPHVVRVDVDADWAENAWAEVKARALELMDLRVAAPSPMTLDTNMGMACGTYGGCRFRTLCYGNTHEQEAYMSTLDPAVAAAVAQALAAQGHTLEAPAEQAPPAAPQLTPEQLAQAAAMFARSEGAASEAPPPAPEPEKPKRKRGRPKKTEAPADFGPAIKAPEPTPPTPEVGIKVEASADTRRVLYVGCMPDRPCPRLFQTQAYRDACAKAAQVAKAPSWDLAEYGKGPALLAQAFDVAALPSEVIVDMRLAGSRALAHLLYDWADMIVSATL